MKNKMIGLTLLVSFMGSSFVLADKTAKKTLHTDYSEMTVLDKGVKRTIKVKRTSDTENTLTTKEETPVKKGVIIAFKKSSNADVFAFETKYGLKLKKRLVTGYYIFQNVSDKGDAEIVSNIIKNEKNIRTVKPNWKKNNLPR